MVIAPVLNQYLIYTAGLWLECYLRNAIRIRPSLDPAGSERIVGQADEKLSAEGTF